MHGVLPESRGGRSDFHIPWVKDAKVRRAAIDTMASRAKSVTGIWRIFGKFLEVSKFSKQIFFKCYKMMSKCLGSELFIVSKSLDDLDGLFTFSM